MRWFRLHIGFGTRLALFALAGQLVLSFGHIHIGKLAPAPLQAIWTTQGSARDGDSDSNHQAGANDVCAICTTIGLLAGSVLPTTSAVLPPLATEHRWPSRAAETRATSDPYFLFQARAPPIV
jgi:hypothetical protein